MQYQRDMGVVRSEFGVWVFDFAREGERGRDGRGVTLLVAGEAP